MTYLNTFLKDYGLWIALALCVIIIVTVLAIYLSAHQKKSTRAKKAQEFQDFVMALGGNENIVQATFKGSRLSVVLHDYQLVDEKKLETLGVSSFIKMSNKITLVTAEAEKISTYIQEITSHQ